MRQNAYLIGLVGDRVSNDGPGQSYTLPHASRQLRRHQPLNPTQTNGSKAARYLGLPRQEGISLATEALSAGVLGRELQPNMPERLKYLCNYYAHACLKMKRQQYLQTHLNL